MGIHLRNLNQPEADNYDYDPSVVEPRIAEFGIRLDHWEEHFGVDLGFREEVRENKLPEEPKGWVNVELFIDSSGITLADAYCCGFQEFIEIKNMRTESLYRLAELIANDDNPLLWFKSDEVVREEESHLQYKFIAAWGAMLGSNHEYIRGEQKKALEDSAPFDSIYRDPDGKWHTIMQVQNDATRKNLIKWVEERG